MSRKRGAKAESAARDRGRPVEPDPGNAGEGKQLPHPFRIPALQRKTFMIASKASFEPQSSEPLPNSKKVYVAGSVHHGIRVPFREITSQPDQVFQRNDRSESLQFGVYDCSGPWGDPTFMETSNKGCPRCVNRGFWRAETSKKLRRLYKPIAGRSDASIPTALAAQAVSRQSREKS